MPVSEYADLIKCAQAMATQEGTASTSDVVCEFLEAAIHTIIRVRGIYPSDVFERRRLYNVAVSKSRHPGLNEYIRETVYSLKPWIEGGELEKLAVVFLDREDKPLERLVFQVKVDPKQLESSNLSYDELEHQLRGAFVKMQVGLTALPEGTKFELVCALNKLPSREEAVWVHEDEERYHLGTDPKIIPIKSITTGVIQTQIWQEL